MPDYGHDLRFGTFITPSNANPQAPVALAQLSEQLGFDLATFQDHPYQAAFLDAWTLMSWVAARTDRIHISGNVLNLPLRPPAVLARAAISLDLLSGGRFELGLGAGAFWDAVASLGVPKLTPGQSVTALSEGIDVIRGIWDTENRSPLHLNGEHYSVHGAKRGPQAAHRIPIVLGALKPRMLKMIGTKADGWLPSLAYLQPGDFGRGNEVIDAAADAAGRRPDEIRRWANINGVFSSGAGFLQGSPPQWAEQLAELALTDGLSTMVLASDDPRMMQVFAEEVIPAVRETVATERARRGTAPAPGRSAAALSRRAPGIDYDAIPASLRPRVIEPGDFGYAAVKSTYMRGGQPGAVIQATTAEEVSEGIAFATTQDVPLGIRSGGHGISGRSTNDGGIVIDLSRMNTIEIVDEAERLVRIGPGARWQDVAAKLAERGWALTSGDYGGVGVGGLATAGGVGFFAREHGLTIDHIESVDVVTATGERVTASRDENADLFWAMRGAGANFGIATSFLFRVAEVGEIGFAMLSYAVDDVPAFLSAWGDLVERSPREVTSSLHFGSPRSGVQQGMAVIVVDSDDTTHVSDILQEFAGLAPMIDAKAHMTTYDVVIANAADTPHQGSGEPVSRSALVEHITPELARAAARLLASGGSSFLQFRAVGGAVSDVADDATAYAHRSAGFAVAAFGASDATIDPGWADIRAESIGAYLSFESGTAEARIDDAFPPATLARLRGIKGRWDPTNVFRDNFNI